MCEQKPYPIRFHAGPRAIRKCRHSLIACLHEGGGPQVGQVTRLGGVTRLSILSLILS